MYNAGVLYVVVSAKVVGLAPAFKTTNNIGVVVG
jgi:hypothetical protein